MGHLFRRQVRSDVSRNSQFIKRKGQSNEQEERGFCDGGAGQDNPTAFLIGANTNGVLDEIRAKSFVVVKDDGKTMIVLGSGPFFIPGVPLCRWK